jgi:hypothetical protein
VKSWAIASLLFSRRLSFYIISFYPARCRMARRNDATKAFRVGGPRVRIIGDRSDYAAVRPCSRRSVASHCAAARAPNDGKIHDGCCGLQFVGDRAGKDELVTERIGQVAGRDRVAAYIQPAIWREPAGRITATHSAGAHGSAHNTHWREPRRAQRPVDDGWLRGRRTWGWNPVLQGIPPMPAPIPRPIPAAPPPPMVPGAPLRANPGTVDPITQVTRVTANTAARDRCIAYLTLLYLSVLAI